MSQNYGKNDKYGRYELSTEGPLLIAKVTGVLGTGLSKSYLKNLTELAAQFQGKPWVYIADCNGYQASIPEAAENLRRAYTECLKLGCVGDAYCIDSAVGINQLAQIRRQSQINTDIHERIFADMDKAKAAMLKFLQDAVF
ncbi:hypothetical protein [Bowmanella yangjiangensis]|uniref:Uncharacterized protein n=1 Tax=Bowmanella yangjiangensis TaxID=2811230 RepID=A0ABS3CV92_9ALTE|nr:hypothetical protein [Bowmanella yangjiangensis]MBN7821029.1 hypothetical protein [Bowmanella yangjiangensis]